MMYELPALDILYLLRLFYGKSLQEEHPLIAALGKWSTTAPTAALPFRRKEIDPYAA